MEEQQTFWQWPILACRPSGVGQPVTHLWGTGIDAQPGQCKTTKKCLKIGTENMYMSSNSETSHVHGGCLIFACLVHFSFNNNFADIKTGNHFCLANQIDIPDA